MYEIICLPVYEMISALHGLVVRLIARAGLTVVSLKIMNRLNNSV